VMDELVMGTTGSAVRSRKATPPEESKKVRSEMVNGKIQTSSSPLSLSLSLSLSLIRVYSPPNEENRSIVSRIKRETAFHIFFFVLFSLVFVLLLGVSARW
jgi:hypothetical protein